MAAPCCNQVTQRLRNAGNLQPEKTANIRIGGLVPLSLTDYPGQLSAVVFCQGCPWRCAYCHNPHLLERRGATEIAWPDVLAFLARRRRLLDAVVFSGGEPTLHAGLPAAIHAVKDMGFAIGLHTAGVHPRRLRAVLPLLDWIGMDIKAPFEDYPRITGVAGSGARALESMKLVIASGIAHEFRTTVHPALLTHEAIFDIARVLRRHGARRYALQEFRAQGCTASGLKTEAPGEEIDAALAHAIARGFEAFEVRHR